MKANDLRIGNLVEHNGCVCTVMAICDNWLSLDNGDHFPANAKIIESNPLPLSEDILLKAGFTRHEPFFESYPLHPYWSKNGLLLFFNESDQRNIYLVGFVEMRMGKYYAVGLKWIQFVHELQNTFPLTGSELEITL